MIVEQLDVSGLQDHLQRELLRGRQLVEQRHRLVVRRRQARHLREALAQQVVVVAVVHAQVALQYLDNIQKKPQLALHMLLLKEF